jgi:AcrR family transcriptional regulator
VLRPARANGTEPSASDNAQRILRVAERLFAQKGFRATTVRDIARAAHVTHPLVYHYFGSKRGLLAAAVERSQSRMRAVAERGGEPRDVIAGLVRDNLAGNRLYLRTLTRAFADGMQPADWPGGFPAVEAILAMLSGERPGGDSQAWETEVRELIAVSVAMAVGWAVLQDQLLEVVGLSAEHRDEARERLVQAFVEILRPALPPDRS